MVLLVMYFHGFITSVETGHKESVYIRGSYSNVSPVVSAVYRKEAFWAQLCLLFISRLMVVSRAASKAETRAADNK